MEPRHREEVRPWGPALILLLIAAIMAALGCTTARTAGQVSRAVVQEMPGVELEREFGFTLGRMSLGLLRGMAGLAGDDLDEETREILGGLRRIEVASYVVVGASDSTRRPRLDGLERRYARKGWQRTVATAEEDELVWLLCRSDDQGTLRGLLAIVLDGEELTVVRLEGDLDLALEAMASEEPDEFVTAFLPSS